LAGGHQGENGERESCPGGRGDKERRRVCPDDGGAGHTGERQRIFFHIIYINQITILPIEKNR
jgi:hypothetical protein